MGEQVTESSNWYHLISSANRELIAKRYPDASKKISRGGN